jgi:hypothetical protein
MSHPWRTFLFLLLACLSISALLLLFFSGLDRSQPLSYFIIPQSCSRIAPYALSIKHLYSSPVKRSGTVVYPFLSLFLYFAPRTLFILLTFILLPPRLQYTPLYSYAKSAFLREGFGIFGKLGHFCPSVLDWGLFGNGLVRILLSMYSYVEACLDGFRTIME